ncbi:MAG: DUF3375 family protein, partial [Campylobacterales bacterium]|nr:DUF3375 family protein [Campylobacterales bacterium]
MTFEYLKNLKSHNQTLKLLNSDNFAMNVSFFVIAFEKDITLKQSDITTLLDDYLYNLNQSNPNIFPKSAKEYLEDFCSDKSGYLRKYHGSEDEPIYELTPHTQQALEFVQGL